MAFSRLLRASIAPATGLGAALVGTTSTAFADTGAPSTQVRPGRASNGDKLPIYTSPDDDKVVTLVLTPNPLVEHITAAREATANALGGVRNVVEDGVSKWIGFERSVEREVKQIVPKDESLNPGIIYVLVAGLTGSVLTRTRSFPVRFLAPPLFAAAALPYFLPKTAHNLRQYFSDLEDKHAPEFAARQDRFNHALEIHWHMTVDRLRGAGDEARQWSAKAAEGVESATGLKVSEAVRLGQERVEKAKESAEAKIERTKEQAQAKIESAKEKAQAKIEQANEKATSEQVTVEVKKIATVVEQKPIAEIVVPVAAPDAPPNVVETTAAPAEVATVTVPATETEAKPEAKEAAPKKKDVKPRDVVARPVEDTGKRLV